MLESQLQQATHNLDNQVRFQRDYLTAQATNQKRLFASQTDQEVREHENALQLQYREHTLSIQHHTSQKRLQLAHQALLMTLNYRQKKAEEEMARRQSELEQMQRQMQEQLSSDVKRMSLHMSQRSQASTTPLSRGVLSNAERTPQSADMCLKSPVLTKKKQSRLQDPETSLQLSDNLANSHEHSKSADGRAEDLGVWGEHITSPDAVRKMEKRAYSRDHILDHVPF
eukprot:GEMP01078541.1.p1 GENE.GEMP01078541.1~~GEMP01078541.1.p1  ORF type:complete len:227 (+),score=44.85 GEMP01078541.1:191-871(+)